MGGAREPGTEARPYSDRGRRRRALVSAAGSREVRRGPKETSCVEELGCQYSHLIEQAINMIHSLVSRETKLLLST